MKVFCTAAVALTAFCMLSTGQVTGANAASAPTSIRVFEEPLVPVGSSGSPAEDGALASSLKNRQKTSYEDASAIVSFLDAHPQSRWRFSLLANLGIIYRRTGYFSEALDVWEEAWALGKGEKDYKVQALANRVASELAALLSSLGRTERLKSLLAETKGRALYGSANALLMTAKENLWLMVNKPGDSFKCGPYALDSIKTFADKREAHSPLIRQARSASTGLSLTQVRNLSNKLKMDFQIAKRERGSTFVIPSVVHWKSGHYAALLSRQGDFYLTKDPTFGTSMLVSKRALEDESSGYFLVPKATLPTGWRTVSDTEGSAIWGRGQVSDRNPGNTKCNDSSAGGSGSCCGGGSPASSAGAPSPGMATYKILTMLVSLSIQDTPVGYTPPVGPDAHFSITYNQLEATQPSTFSFFNFGPCWNCSWLSYITPPSSTGGTAFVNTRGGGQETYSTYNSTGSSYAGYIGYYGNELQSQATLWVTSATPATYERRLPDGSKEVFGLCDSTGFVFLTAITDPQGNSMTLGYDSSFRLITVTDALGLQTTVVYGLSPNPAAPANPLTYLVTKIIDPYGRFATFTYSSSTPYQLTTITDVIGITSQFTYGTGSAITQMITPYGTTAFSASSGDDTIPVRVLNVTEPDGSQVHAESDLGGSNYPFSNEPVPSGYGSSDSIGWVFLMYRNTYYWNKMAMEMTGNNPDSDYTKAYIYHFLHTVDGQESGVLESEKPSLENRIWYNYPNQDIWPIYVGSSANPTIVARVVTSGNATTTQATQYQYNNPVNPAALTAVIDPLGRQTNYSYDAATGLDLLSVTQVNGSGTDTLKTVTYSNATNPPHCPQSTTDAAGQTTSFTYNTQGQVTSITPPVRAGHSSEPTVYTYTNNFLTSITRPMAGAVTTIVPDALNGKTINRLKSQSDPESYTINYSYDNLDRVTAITYPDTTTEQFVYSNLDLQDSYDRLNRKTHRVYDATRHLLSITDPLNRTTQYGWCICGALSSWTDPKGNVTSFLRDGESRVTAKVYPDATQIGYVYDPTTSRLITRTDARGDVATYTYNLDETFAAVSYKVVAGTAATPSVTYAYDPYYPRMVAAGGVSTTYVPAGSPGAGQVLTVSNALAGGSANVSYLYDEWGRVVTRTIDGDSSQTYVFDPIGRVASVTNLLSAPASFTYTYFDPSHPTNRVGSITNPNGQQAVYNYFGNSSDERLQEIKNTTSSGAVISQQDYAYNAVGDILMWQQQTDSSTPLSWAFGYDAADQLTGAVQTNTAIPSPTIMQDTYTYDPAGNATAEAIGTVSRTSSFNDLNQLTSSTASGNQSVYFTGLLNGASTVTVNGVFATTNTTSFAGSATLAPGSTSTVTVVAQDTKGDSRTSHYQIAVPAQTNYTPTYDADGNELSNGAGQSYTWDAKNQLSSIRYSGSNTTTFTYDPFCRRIAIVETGTSPSTKQFVWDGQKLAEQRDSSNVTTARFFMQGEQINGTPYFFTRDHLGSVREFLDGAQALHARYSYDAFGCLSKISGDKDSDFGFTNDYTHAPSTLALTKFRAYDANLGRWLSRDPEPQTISYRERDSYRYCFDNPVNAVDPLGLFAVYGNYCGPDWTGGREEPYIPGDALMYSPPIDKLDAACRAHDICYYNCRHDFPCNAVKRKACMQTCNNILSATAAAIGGFWGRVIEGGMIPPPDPGPNASDCCPFSQ